MIYLLGLAVVIVVVMITHDPATRYCRWRKDRSRNEGDRIFWTCDYCGASRLTDGLAPDSCARR